MTQLFDRALMLENLDGDEELAQDILSDAVTEIPKQVINLQTACDEGDSLAIRHYAHTLKGMTVYLCAPLLHDICAKIENAGKDGNVETSRTLLLELEETAWQTLKEFTR